MWCETARCCFYMLPDHLGVEPIVEVWKRLVCVQKVCYIPELSSAHCIRV